MLSETYKMFNARLSDYFTYYAEACGITTFQQLHLMTLSLSNCYVRWDPISSHLFCLGSPSRLMRLARLKICMFRCVVMLWLGGSCPGGAPGMGSAKKLQGQIQAPTQSHFRNNAQLMMDCINIM